MRESIGLAAGAIATVFTDGDDETAYSSQRRPVEWHGVRTRRLGLTERTLREETLPKALWVT